MSKWSVVHTVTFLQDAYMIKSYLESAGIETLIPDEFTAQVNNFYTTAANRMARGLWRYAVTTAQVTDRCEREASS